MLKKFVEELGSPDTGETPFLKDLLSLEPDPSFVDATLNKWAADQAILDSTSNWRLTRLFPLLAVASVFLLLISFGSIYYTEGSIDTSSIIGIDELTDEEAYVLTNE